MANRDDMIVGGYFFGSIDDAKQATKELKNAEYLNERVSVMSSHQLLALYDKMIDEKVFLTPVGWEYLKYIKNLTIRSGIDESLIRPIPIYTTFGSSNDDRNYEHIAKMYVKPTKSKGDSIKDKLKISVILNIFLLVIIIAMFFITMNSTSPNIINYKTVITNQYSVWENELNEREAAIKAKELELENTNS